MLDGMSNLLSESNLTWPMAKLSTFWDYILGKIKFKLLFQGPLAKRGIKIPDKKHNTEVAGSRAMNARCWFQICFIFVLFSPLPGETILLLCITLITT